MYGISDLYGSAPKQYYKLGFEKSIVRGNDLSVESNNRIIVNSNEIKGL